MYSEASGGIGDEQLDSERRLISCLIEGPVPRWIVSLYVPHGRKIGDPHFNYKLAYLDGLARHVATWLRDGHLIVTGDVNVATIDSDVFHPSAFVGLTHFTPVERASWNGVLDAGLVDVKVARWGPRARRLTWWNHGIGYSRSLGKRLDVIAADRALADSLDTTWIDHVERNTERPSDHAALIADFELAPSPDRSKEQAPISTPGDAASPRPLSPGARRYRTSHLEVRGSSSSPMEPSTPRRRSTPGCRPARTPPRSPCGCSRRIPRLEHIRRHPVRTGHR
jgi:exodeoxyribonuclease III